MDAHFSHLLIFSPFPYTRPHFPCNRLFLFPWSRGVEDRQLSLVFEESRRVKTRHREKKGKMKKCSRRAGILRDACVHIFISFGLVCRRLATPVTFFASFFWLVIKVRNWRLTSPPWLTNFFLLPLLPLLRRRLYL